MKRHRARADIAFDHLLKTRYGDARYAPPDRLATRWLPGTAEELFAGRYGKKHHHHHHGHHNGDVPPALSIQSSVDDGETLRTGNGAELEEYVVARSLSEEAFEEYVVDRLPAPESTATSASLAEASPDPQQECNVDVLDVLATPTANRLSDNPPVAASPAAGAAPAPRAAPAPAEGAPMPAAPAATSTQASVAKPAGSTGSSEDDFIADMQSILSGQKVYDARSGTVTSREALKADPPAPAQKPTAEPPVSNGQAIFDKIAENMRYANAYDLGSVELDNRFGQFDRQWDEERQAEAARRKARADARRSAAGKAPPPKEAPTEEFLADLDTVRREALARTGAAEPQPNWEALAQSTATPESRELDPGAGTLWGDATSPDAAAFALDTGTGGQLNDAFVAQALKVSFANANDVNSYFAQFGQPSFVAWFNANAANKGPWAHRSLGTGAGVEANFTAIWDRIPQIFGTTNINLLQFLSLMSILINEVGGTLAPISERVGTKDHPGLAYAFDRIKDLKASYNTGSLNWSAFKCFNDADFIQAHGSKPKGAQLQNTTDARWKGDVWPSGFATDVDPSVNGFIMEADFYKFRGRGLIQSTWRSAYKDLIGFIQSYTGTQAAISSRTQQWTGLSQDKVASISSNADWDELFTQSSLEIPCVAIAQHNQRAGNYLALAGNAATLNGKDGGSIWNVGRRISGGSKYADLFRSRVIAVCNLIGN